MSPRARRSRAWPPWLLLALAGAIGALALLPVWRERAEAVRGLPVLVSVPPQAWLLEQLGGERVDVQVLLPPGADPHTYEPTPQQVERASRARLVVPVGHPALLFEQQLLRSLHREAQRLERVPMGAPATPPAASAGAANAAADPHLWLSPRVMRGTAERVSAALARLDPAGAPFYRERLRATQQEIDRVDAAVRRELSSLPRRRFLVYHPAWGHFAREYGLEQVAIEADGKEPSARRLTQLVAEARRDGVQTVFVQEGSADRSARVVAEEIGARVVRLDPLARSWPEGLLHTAGRLREALGG